MIGRGRGRGGSQTSTPRPFSGASPRTPAAGSANPTTAKCMHGVPPGAAATLAFVAKLNKLSQESEFFDYTISCDDTDYKVSRLMISAHSPYFKRACTRSFKEGHDGAITLQEDEPSAVRAMVQFFRDRTYESSKTTPRTHHFEVFVVADKYEVSDLKDLALSNFTKSMTELTEQALGRTLIAITPLVYAATPADNRLRELVLQRWHDSGIALSLGTELETLVGDCPAFGAGLILMMTMPASKIRSSFYAQKTLLTFFKVEPERLLFSAHMAARKTGLPEDDVVAALSALAASGQMMHGPAGSWYRDK